MRICLTVLSADAKEMRRQGELAFTMIEIALAIGVIGFALVAIIGILPAGMNVQKNDREDTTVSEDAPYFIDAIKNGTVVSNGVLNGAGYVAYPSRGLDFLTNYVQLVEFASVYPSGSGLTTNVYNVFSNFYSGSEIIGLLSTPQTNSFSPYFPSNFFITRAYVRALNGPASAQQGGGNGQMNSFMAFTYQMDVMITPYNKVAPDTTNYTNYLSSTDPNQWIIRSNRWLEASWYAINNTVVPLPIGYNMVTPPGMASGAAFGGLAYNLFDVTVRFSWPVIMNGLTVQSVGPRHQTYHTMVAASMAQAYTNIDGGVYTWYFQPQNYTNYMVSGL